MSEYFLEYKQKALKYLQPPEETSSEEVKKSLFETTKCENLDQVFEYLEACIKAQKLFHENSKLVSLELKTSFSNLFFFKRKNNGKERRL